ncbi:hypothetical protein ACLOJK_010853 [Asimina triloba]
MGEDMNTRSSFSSLSLSQQAILLHGSFKLHRRWQYHIPETSSRRSSAPIRVHASLEKATKIRNKKGERDAYLFAALASSLGLTSMAAGAVYYRFAWQMGGEIPVEEAFGTFALAIGASGWVGLAYSDVWMHTGRNGILGALGPQSTMAFFALEYARGTYAGSHHRPSEGLFELNDVFAIINCIPAISLMAYGFFNHGLLSGLSFGAGLGITVYGMAYMFVHDGLIHKRFPVGPIANVPYLQKVAAAHQDPRHLHHADKFNGDPFGLFLGPKELEEAGGSEELERLIKARRGHCGCDNESAEGLNL